MRVDAISTKSRRMNRIQCANVISTGANCAYGLRRSLRNVMIEETASRELSVSHD
jgi:hypothetical protein